MRLNEVLKPYACPLPPQPYCMQGGMTRHRRRPNNTITMPDVMASAHDMAAYWQMQLFHMPNHVMVRQV